jgi:diguanylate cyclase (GGDEF)-like protein/PAS domain S-box-containing protein
MSNIEKSIGIPLLNNAAATSLTWLERTPVCIKIIDPALNLQYMNKVAIKSLGISDVLPYYGKPYLLEFYPKSFHEQTSENIKHSKNTGKAVTQEAALLDLNRAEIWFQSTILPVYDEDNKLEYFMIVSIDITDRKSTETKLDQMNAKLDQMNAKIESLVANRTKELEEANKQLKISSETDFLTQLSNRKFYERRLNENISTAKRNNTYLALLMIDIDNFKAFNDKYGHDIGDTTIRDVAEVIKNSLQRTTDLVSRFGGEEFVVLLPETDGAGAFEIAERIRMNIEALGIKHSQSKAGFVTVSIGIRALKADQLNKIDLFKHSDIALYSAKNNGKNRSVTYLPKHIDQVYNYQ